MPSILVGRFVGALVFVVWFELALVSARKHGPPNDQQQQQQRQQRLQQYQAHAKTPSIVHCREHLLKRVLAFDGLFFAKESSASSAPIGAADCFYACGFCPPPADDGAGISAARFDEGQKQMGFGKLGGSTRTQCR